MIERWTQLVLRLVASFLMALHRTWVQASILFTWRYHALKMLNIIASAQWEWLGAPRLSTLLNSDRRYINTVPKSKKSSYNRIALPFLYFEIIRQCFYKLFLFQYFNELFRKTYIRFQYFIVSHRFISKHILTIPFTGDASWTPLGLVGFTRYHQWRG